MDVLSLSYVASKLLLQTTVSVLPRLRRSNLAGHWAKKLQLFLQSVAELGMPDTPVLIIDEVRLRVVVVVVVAAAAAAAAAVVVVVVVVVVCVL
jgi:hypothetical protein